MAQAYSETTLTAQVKFPNTTGKRNYEKAFATTDLPQVPYMYNPRKIKKNTKLVCTPDLEMKKLHAAQVAEKIEAAKKKAKQVDPAGAKPSGAK